MRDNDDDLITLFMLLSGAVSSGMFAGMFLEPARDWAVQHGLLALGDAVIVPIVDGVGLGLPQLLILGGGLALLLVLGGTLIHRRLDKKR
ncbi:hypothetical protein E4U02_07415 [Microbacterium paludicola]|uniref:Uncharacterized protein n=1 Tax=Microbacterium paludicola TaxID=300019 RepID=A0A4Y9FUQ5_9MICO|nr:hypothetical protein [Microbacterium paludicola]MBF0816232.1 hypothetical protein [Microbacterium paludicola]TFU33038.1 hypothetical protein E4U02_07415 [Microbacterium paludicola]